jgi:hypothetical protein
LRGSPLPPGKSLVLEMMIGITAAMVAFGSVASQIAPAAAFA